MATELKKISSGGEVAEEVDATPVYTDKTAREIIETLEGGGNVVLKWIVIEDGVEYLCYLGLLSAAIEDGHCYFTFGNTKQPYYYANLEADSLDGFLYQGGGTSGASPSSSEIIDPSSGTGGGSI